MSQKPSTIKIVKMRAQHVQPPTLSELPTMADLLQYVGRVYDKHNVHELVGNIYAQTEDGRKWALGIVVDATEIDEWPEPDDESDWYDEYGVLIED